jgi:hypothetical protein
MPQQSEVAALRATIEAEYQAAYQAVHGYSEGSVRHAVIAARMGRAQEAARSLEALIGKEAAKPLIIDALDAAHPS